MRKSAHQHSLTGFTRHHVLSKNGAGFTLVEMMVAISLFAIIMVVTVDIMLTVLTVQSKTTELQAMQDNARFSLELITKELRTGINHSSETPVCGASGSEIHFTATSGERVYYLDAATKRIMRATQAVTGADQCAGRANNRFSAFTADGVAVEELTFLVRGNGAGPNDGQPAITVALFIAPSLRLQTTVVQRARDL
ncbi:MAG: prepilin-type N-terminal cleavage/methylation domain-containing protein [Candidatus Sungbacteria bacterium]|nr:prepilin-type N-terminal cleavage/methylation domain-containing protein [Candidatus Sungbacteria bacterium]